MANEVKYTNLERKYKEEVVPKMMKKFGYVNIMQVPRLVKCSVNMGVGKASEDIKLLEDASKELASITGQKPVYRRAKKSVSNFKIREGQPIGCSTTLRKKIMYEFLDRLLNVALPRIRDFQGISSKGFDRTGNYTLGLKEQSVFPEVVSDRITRNQGMDITIVTTANTDEEALHLLSYLGMPFRDGNSLLVLDK